MDWCSRCVRKGTEYCDDCHGSASKRPFNFLPKIETLEPIDMIHKPIHYHKGSIDVIGYLEQHFSDRKYTVAEGFAIGNAIKYTSRYKEKGGLEDLKKANFYINKLIKYEEGTDK